VVVPAAAAIEPDDAGEDGIEDVPACKVELGPGGGIGAILFRNKEERIAGPLNGTDTEAVRGADNVIALGLDRFAGDFGLVEKDEVAVREEGLHFGVGGEAGDEGLGGRGGEIVGNGMDLAGGALAGDGLMESEETGEHGYGLEAGIAVGIGSGEVAGDFVAGE